MASLSIYENFLIDNEIRKEQKKIIRDNDFYKITRPYVTADMLPRNTIKKVRLKAGTHSKRDYALIVLLHEGGLRISEALNLQLKRDIDFEMFTILILGKGNKVRKIYMNEIIVDALRDYIEEREKLLNGRINKYLFVSNKTANNNKPMNRTSINKILENYCKIINESKINPHILRHDCGTLMYEEGCTEIMIKKKLGHSSNAVDIYTHPNLQMLKNK